MSTSVTTFLLLLLLAMASTFSCHQSELNTTIQLAQTKVQQARNWFHTLMELHGLNRDSNYVAMALSDCATLYDESEPRLASLVSGESYTVDDARTWLSAVLANHLTCLAGLRGKGLVETNVVVVQNLSNLLVEALALYGKAADMGTRAGGGQKAKANPSVNGGLLASWDPVKSKANFVVAKDGSGTHRTINEAVKALDRMGHKRPQRVIVYVKAGVYNEKVVIDRNMRNFMFVGDGMGKTIVTGRRNVPDGDSTLTSATFGVSGDGFWARDITFENTAGPQKHQAVALRVSSDRSVFYRCGIIGYQDTLYTHSLRQFYRDCHIYGTIDFIFGDASAVLQNCDIFVRRPMNHQANMITAQGRSNPNENTGISIQNSRVKAAPSFVGVQNSFRTYLGRPWRKYSRTVFMKTDLDRLIDPKGWTEWEGKFALSTLFYGEYMNTGPGASTSQRVNWPGFHVLNSSQQASPFTAANFIQGESWIPVTGVPFSIGI